ncbi:MAG: ABC transporter permease [Flammeovirgaceae bacterium]|nr:ABC transporter permease [Flammeovirgaceae bacterium]
MIIHYLKLGYRNLITHKFVSLINILGLVLGFCSSIAILAFVIFQLSFDDFHKSGNSIYRIHLGSNENSQKTFPKLGLALQNDYPEIEYATRLKKGSGLLKGNNKGFNENKIYWVDENFFQVFGYDLKIGNEKSVLIFPNSVVISKSTAKKYFGDEDPINKTFHHIVQGKKAESYNVTGVFDDFPPNSHLQCDFLFSYNTLKESSDYYLYGWNWRGIYTYVKLGDYATPDKVEEKFTDFLDKYKNEKYSSLKSVSEISLVPITKVHFSKKNSDAEIYGDLKTIKLFSVLSILIIIIAIINYINSTTSKAIERSKEVGLRKVLGAKKHNLIIQFTIESCFITFISLLISIIIFYYLTPFFEQVSDIPFSKIGFLQKPVFYIAICLAFFLVNIISFLYPAFILSSFKPVKGLYNVNKRSKKGFSHREIFCVFQFAISIGLIVISLVIYSQVNYIANKDMGINIDNIIVISPPKTIPTEDGNNKNLAEVFKTKIQNIPSVSFISYSDAIPGENHHSFWWDLKIVDRENNDLTEVEFALNNIDADFMDTYDLNLLGDKVGRNFYSEIHRDSNSVLINQMALKKFGFVNVDSAIGNLIQIGDDQYEIIGVTANYHHNSPKENFIPTIYNHGNVDYPYFSIKISGNTNNEELLNTMNKIWMDVYPDNIFEYYFLDEFYNKQYVDDLKFSKVIQGFTILAVFIACLGAFTLASFTISRKRKEFGIRKTFGASSFNLLKLIYGKQFNLVLISGIFGLPLGYIFSVNWLATFAFKINLTYEYFVFPLFLVVLILFLTISYQSILAINTKVSEIIKEN